MTPPNLVPGAEGDGARYGYGPSLHLAQRVIGQSVAHLGNHVGPDLSVLGRRRGRSAAVWSRIRHQAELIFGGFQDSEGISAFCRRDVCWEYSEDTNGPADYPSFHTLDQVQTHKKSSNRGPILENVPASLVCS